MKVKTERRSMAIAHHSDKAKTKGFGRRISTLPSSLPTLSSSVHFESLGLIAMPVSKKAKRNSTIIIATAPPSKAFDMFKKKIPAKQEVKTTKQK